MFNQDWETAANHASEEIRSWGIWTCPCEPCQRVRFNMLTGTRNGRCVECGQALESKRRDYCSPACKQKAYRRRSKKPSK